MKFMFWSTSLKYITHFTFQCTTFLFFTKSELLLYIIIKICKEVMELIFVNFNALMLVIASKKIIWTLFLTDIKIEIFVYFKLMLKYKLNPIINKSHWTILYFKKILLRQMFPVPSIIVLHQTILLINKVICVIVNIPGLQNDVTALIIRIVSHDKMII